MQLLQANLDGSISAKKAEFWAAKPFPMIVVDDFLDPDFARQLVAEFPKVDQMPKSRDYVFGNKHELSSVAEAGPASSSYHDFMLSDEFAKALSELVGRPLFVDPDSHGGGFHQGASESFLDMHVDFNVHPLHPEWLRVLNILLYLNEDWPAEYGGELIIKSSRDGEEHAIAPLFNRAVIMLTNDHTFHGYHKMTLPPGVTRKSLASYAYEHVEAGSVRSRTTQWVPEQSSSPAKKLFAKYYNPLVQVKTKIFGSSTAKNR